MDVAGGVDAPVLSLAMASQLSLGTILSAPATPRPPDRPEHADIRVAFAPNASRYGRQPDDPRAIDAEYAGRVVCLEELSPRTAALPMSVAPCTAIPLCDTPSTPT